MHSEFCSLALWQCEVIARYFSPYSVKLSFWNISDNPGMHIQCSCDFAVAINDCNGYVWTLGRVVSGNHG